MASVGRIRYARVSLPAAQTLLAATIDFRVDNGRRRVAGKQDPDAAAAVPRFAGTRIQVMRIVAP
jgi:hypothetical protein